MSRAADKKARQAAKYPADINDHYVIKETIGSGGFAKVKLARHKMTGEKVAIKVMDKEHLRQTDDLDRVTLEIQALKSFRHQHISRLYQAVETKEKFFLVLEYAPGGELFDYIVAKDRCKEEEARVFFRQICAAVAFIHSKGYAHRDLKPENLLLDAGQNIKLIDFGLIGKPKNLKTDFLHTCCGSAAYAAPELIRGEPYLGEPADVWSLGILLYALLCGFLPFDDENTQRLYRLIQRGQYEVPPWLSVGSQKLISALLKHKPEHRLTMDQLLKHPWLLDGVSDKAVSWQSTQELGKFDLDPAVVAEMAKFYSVDSETMEQTLTAWDYDPVSANYELLCLRKSKGGNIRLPPAKGELASKSVSFHPSLSIPNGRSPLSQAGYGFGSSETLAVSTENLQIAEPVTPTKSRPKGRPRAGTIAIGELTSPAKTPPSNLAQGSWASHGIVPGHGLDTLPEETTPMKRFGSNPQLASPGPHSSAPCPPAAAAAAPEPAPLGSSFHRGSLRGSFRSLLGSMFGGSSRMLSEPRKVKGLFNVSTTSTKEPRQVHEEILRVLREKNCEIKEKGFVIKATMPESEGKTNVVLTLEVCKVQRMHDLTGIRLARVKGDAWAYKKVTQELLGKLNL
eukprot:m.480195 g.480195  ORF g.480195 m.480195 type:complete len:624 (+) comp21736_c0_seq1:434-2305(+)